MKRKKIFFIILGVSLLFFFYFKDLPRIIKNYPEQFIALGNNISLSTPIRFYNTYETLSAGQYKIDMNSPGSRNCSPLNLRLPEEEPFIKLISDASYEYGRKYSPKTPYIKETTFTYIGANCTKKAKLIHLEYKGNEAHATFACERGNLVQEFTYSSTDDKCAVMEYRKEWGIKPIERTLGYTKNLILN